MTQIIFTIPGPPQGKARPRVTRRGITYTPDKTVAYEELTRLRYLQAAGGYRFPDKQALQVFISAMFDIPKSTSKTKRLKMLSGAIRPTKKPDCDNIAKIICDALGGIAYKDDCQIVDAHVSKYYGITPQVQVTLMERNTDEGI